MGETPASAVPASSPPDLPPPGRPGLPGPRLLVRAIFGGLLMGLANLVPGISGGTMLLATGVYPGFVGAIAELTTLRPTRRSLALLIAIAGSAGAVILLLAGPTRGLVIAHRWLMYSLFIGLTLGGVPIVWRMAGRPSPALGAGALAGFALMAAMAGFGPAGPGQGGGSPAGLFAGGVAGAAAMVLPGVSGGYLLLVLGQYLPILAGIDTLKQGLLPLASGGSPHLDLVFEALHVAAPVGLGVVVGIVAVSNAIRWALDHYRAATLGFLLGLLLGSVLGLWPFQRPAEEPSALAAASAGPRRGEGRLEAFSPSPAQAAVSLGLIAAGFGITLAIGRLGETESG